MIVSYDMRRVVEAYLSRPESIPTETILNQCFVRTLIEKGNICMATILSRNISRIAFEEAFDGISDLIDEGVDDGLVCDILCFLSNGQIGFAVDNDAVDELYLKVSNLFRPSSFIKTSKLLDLLVTDELRRKIKLESCQKKQRILFTARGHAITEIHSYSASEVQALEQPISMESSSNAQLVTEVPSALPMPIPPQTEPRRGRRNNTLNETVLSIIRRRIPSHWEPYTQDRVQAVLSQILTIDGEFTARQQERALSYIESFLNGSSSEILGICLQFVESISNPEDNSVRLLWMRGFVGESIEANSCQMGAVERCVTGIQIIFDSVNPFKLFTSLSFFFCQVFVV